MIYRIFAKQLNYLKHKYMKKLALLFILIMSLNACEKIDKFTQFDLNLDTEITIPAGIPANTPIDFPTISIPLNTKSVLEDNNTTSELIEQATLKKMELKITKPTNGNFNFLKDLEIYISADNLPETKIAWKYDHSNDDQITLSLDTSDEDLQEYIKKDELNMNIHVVFDEILTEDYTIKIYYTFFIDAEILGI